MSVTVLAKAFVFGATEKASVKEITHVISKEITDKVFLVFIIYPLVKLFVFIFKILIRKRTEFFYYFDFLMRIRS